MARPKSRRDAPADTRSKLLAVAIDLVRAQGFCATSVDSLCAAAGVTKGAFFHHFESKESLGVAAAEEWSRRTGALFATAAYHDHRDPFDRVMAYLDFRAALAAGPTPAFTCLVGTMVQEMFATSDPIRVACRASIEGHAATLEADIDAALRRRGVTSVSARSLALHTQAVLQGAFVLAKAEGSPAIVLDSINHLKRYFSELMAPDAPASDEGTKPTGRAH